MKFWIKTTLTSSAIFSVLIVIAIIMFAKSEAYAQFMESYHKLSKAEQHWVNRHPIAAFRSHKLVDTAKNAALKIRNDSDMDSDLNGGMADAFKHTYWMALTAQKIGEKKALSLGQAHEDGNRQEFENTPDRPNGMIQDSIASAMDLYNNRVGAKIGADNPKVSHEVLHWLVKKAVTEGRCRKILKNNRGQYLDKDSNVIDTDKYKGKWAIPKVLIQSNKPTITK